MTDPRSQPENKRIASIKWQLENRQAILAAIVDSSEDAIISKTLQGYITTWNVGATRIFGYTQEEMIGKHISKLIPERYMPEEEYIIARIAGGHKVEHIETIRRTRNGREIPVSLTISPIKDGEGNIIGASKIARDISAQRDAIGRQTLLAAIIDSSGDAIISKNREGIITSWNLGAQKIFGYSQEEVLGKHITLLIPESFRAEEEYIIGCILRGDRVDHFQTVRLTKTGDEVPVSITVSPIMDKMGNIIGASKIVRDISSLVSETQELQKLNEAKDEFIGIASHELKTPLTSIKAYMQVLERKLSDNPIMPFIGKTLQQVNKLSVLIDDLLDVSKIQAGRMQLAYTHFDINHLIREVTEAFAQMDKHEIVFDTPMDTPIIINADRQRIEQVLINMVSNASKYSPNGSRIIIKSRIEGLHLVVSVQDFGIGIDAAEQQKIFTRFYRAEGLAPMYSGLGIGLYISAEIIARHHGQMYVDSELGKGSVFSFKIPPGK